ncbi:Helicase domain-containing protein [Tripterygium wilfordii]|uniref:RNA helicase n=1 Tax=Tripterygium wilfordii TaxID=458696 RepID=A0A7J7DLU4_TRIWF|nr:ATP-dependent RNA helicase DEAH11, chloroplastic-like [Tripterygium wilfordii]KAF5747340.1 Helicase domain-containing protein [Tripterygium wilfordii]
MKQSTGARRSPSPGYDPRFPPFQSRSVRPSTPPSFYPHQLYHQNRPQNQNNRYGQQFRSVAPNVCPECVVQLRASTGESSRSVKKDVDALFSQCQSDHVRVVFSSSGSGSATLYFQQWAEALSSLTKFWELRLSGDHDLAPRLVSRAIDPDELKNRLRALFVEHVKGIMDGEIVKRCQAKIQLKSDEIAGVSAQLKERNKIWICNDLVQKRKGLSAERDLMGKRVKEFKEAMRCLLYYLGEEDCAGVDMGSVKGVRVLKLKGEYDWERIYQLTARECRRLEDGLPIYAYRQQILYRIYEKQTLVLIGETGSGKSTQLVQFLVDSGVAAEESIVCTQPRKIAATSLTQRVREESSGCYKDNSVMCYPTFSSTQQFDSKVIYMTDHCLLQHYMNNRDLSGISCIIIDEAHERSLNTDLVMALVRDLLFHKPNLRLVIMSATANANQLANYFFGCEIFYVVGRNFPVDVRYVPCAIEESSSSKIVSSYVVDVVNMAKEIHKTEKEGTILAFLTSQAEVEWACEKFEAPSAVALPLHGKLSSEEQFQVFQKFRGKRKVIFATNLAETSITIPGVKYVIDSGMVKESKFDPNTGMNTLRVCWISQSSAEQRAGRAGRTEPGRCYRLYRKCDFESMPSNQEPEIRRVHLGVAVLRIMALGIKNVQEFDFVDAPSTKAIDMAIKNLVQLGAIALNNGVFELTEDGRYMVKLGIEPRLGRLILSCAWHRLAKEGLILAAVMANSSSIFCRVGNDEDKLRADGLKVQFCHPSGDLFTLLSVYKEWEAVAPERRNIWCWDNSINAKSMRRCQDTAKELEYCLERELDFIVPTYWRWNPNKSSEHDECLKKVILSALAENVAFYSGSDQLGYEVALNGQHVHLHPSCSLRIFGQKPTWVVFGEVLSTSGQYLVCVTAFDFEYFSTLHPPPLFDVCKMEGRKLEVKVLTGFGATLLKKFCGKSNNNLLSLRSRIRAACMDERICIEINFDQNEIQLFASKESMEKVTVIVVEVLECEKRWLSNECMEKYLYDGHGFSPVALFGAGGEIKHLELGKSALTVDVFHPSANMIDEKVLLLFFEKHTSGRVCSVHKTSGIGQEGDEKEKWGRITFLSPDTAGKATELNGVEFSGSTLKVLPAPTSSGGNHRMAAFPAIKAKIYWPRKRSKGFGVLKCHLNDIGYMLDDFANVVMGGNYVRCEVSKRNDDCVVIYGIDKELSEADILGVLRTATHRRILGFFLVRGDAVENPLHSTCEEALMREISSFMPKRNLYSSCCRVQVFPPEPKDAFMKALMVFDGRLHLEAAKALEHLEGKVLPGCHSWQKLKCQQLFYSSISCPAYVYSVIKKQLDTVLASFNYVKGAEYFLEKTESGSYRVRISANATRTVAELRRPLEELMRGKIINDASLSPSLIQHLFSRDGFNLMKLLQRETGTCILFDRRSLNVRVFGSSQNVAKAEEKLIQSLLTHHESKQLEIRLRGGNLPPDLMKEVVKRFGPDLRGLEQKVPGVELTLNVYRQVISFHGERELRPKVEEIIHEIAQSSVGSDRSLDGENACPICLCEVEDGHRLEGCGHSACRQCLLDQLDSALKNLDSFPICCACEDCNIPILLTDLKSLLSSEKLEELFRASLGAFVATSGGAYRFCPSPDCTSVYQVAEPGMGSVPFVCGACYAETCTRCHLECHPSVSCELYREFKEDPDSSLKEWCRGKNNVKSCPVCGYTIEKTEGCNHVECLCGRHICWVCLDYYHSSEDCYGHLRSVHMTFI